MKKLFMMMLAALTCLGMAAQKPVATTVPGDPMATQCYTLSNGLKVFLSVNHRVRASRRTSLCVPVRVTTPPRPPVSPTIWST